MKVHNGWTNLGHCKGGGSRGRVKVVKGGLTAAWLEGAGTKGSGVQWVAETMQGHKG